MACDKMGLSSLRGGDFSPLIMVIKKQNRTASTDAKKEPAGQVQHAFPGYLLIASFLDSTCILPLKEPTDPAMEMGADG